MVRSVDLDQSPYGRYLGHQEIDKIDAGYLLLPITLYLIGWTLMTVAMMLPTTLPLLEIFRRLTAQRQDQFQLLALVITGIWGSGWASVFAHGADWLLHEIVERSSWLEATPGLSARARCSSPAA